MPYFIEEREGKFCVMKGTKENPEGTEKCHDTREEATAHLRALYVHVEDAGKAAAGVVSTTNLPHGTGSMFGSTAAALGDGDQCVCPECDYETEKGDTPCGEVKCPECGAALA